MPSDSSVETAFFNFATEYLLWVAPYVCVCVCVWLHMKQYNTLNQIRSDQSLSRVRLFATP